MRGLGHAVAVGALVMAVTQVGAATAGTTAHTADMPGSLTLYTMSGWNTA